MRSGLFIIFIWLVGLPVTMVAESLRICVSVPAHADIVKVIGGDFVEVRALQVSGDVCGLFEPRPDRISWLAKSRIYFRSGVGFEQVFLPRWQERFPDLKYVDLREKLELLPWENEGHEAHGHHHSEGHHGAEVEIEWDPHIWLDPSMVKIQAQLIYETLVPFLPETDQGALKNRYTTFLERCDKLEKDLSRLFKPLKGEAVLLYHSALGYLARAYGFEQHAIEASGHAPGPKEMKRIIEQARQLEVETLFLQSGASSREAEIIAKAIGASIVYIDPMATPWEDNLRTMARRLAKVAR